MFSRDSKTENVGRSASGGASSPGASAAGARGILALQQTAGNRAVAALLQSRSTNASTVQRAPDDVHTFIHRLNTGSGPGRNMHGGYLFGIVRQMKAFSDQQQDEETRARACDAGKDAARRLGPPAMPWGTRGTKPSSS